MINSITFIHAHDTGSVSVTTQGEWCSDVCQSFVDFMRAVGFSDATIARDMMSLDIMDEEIDKM